jgi:glutamine cyclotransferase
MAINSSLLTGDVEAAPDQMMYYTVQILRTLPHDTANFTQGLVYYQGMLYESTGLYDRSTLQQIDAGTGSAQKSIAVPQVFAEGLVRWGNRLIQLTWQDHTAFIYNLVDFSKVGQYQYDTEGWGLTADQQSLIMSDGSDILYFRDPFSFDILRTVQVTLNDEPLYRINELEYIRGLVYANIWGEDFIVQIDPNTGQVRGMIDARSLRQMQPSLNSQSVLNGIAHNPEQDTLFLTGKNWPTLFEVTLVQEF